MTPGNDLVDGRPWHAPGEGPAVLCLHGFSGTPFEVTPLGQSLSGAGYSVSVPRLPGHGDTVEALATSTWREWFEGARAAMDSLLAQTGRDRVGIVGSSMGGLLALRLARLYPDKVGAVVAIAVPLRVPSWQAFLVRWLCRLPAPLRRGRLFALPKTDGCDVTDAEMRRRNPTLPAMPFAGIRQLIDLGDEVRQGLSAIPTPCLLAHGLLDHTVSPDRTRELAGRLGPGAVEQLWLPKSGHLVGLDVERDHVFHAVGRFLDKNLR
jgi:carboxylesterase